MSDRWQQNPWNDTTIAKLRELWPDPNLSCAKIAAEIGKDITRNAVIGKAVRLGLGPKPCLKVGKVTKHVPRKPLSKPRAKPARNFGGVWGAYPDKPAETFVPRAVLLPSLGLPVEEWRDDRCKYIAGDDMLACGHPVKAEHSWCPAHHALVYQPKKERTEAQRANDARMATRGQSTRAARPSNFELEVA